MVVTAKAFKTGLPLLDMYLGGGLPRGTASLYGHDSSGATSFALSIAREAALDGHITAFVALKGGTSTKYIRRHCGQACAFSRPRFGEEAFEHACHLIEQGTKVVILDSLDGAVPLADMADMVGTRDASDQYRLLYLGLTTLRDLAMKHNSLVISTSEVRTLLPTKKLVPTYRNSVWDSANTLIKLEARGFKSEYGTVLYRSCYATLERSLTAPPNGETPFQLWDTRGIDRPTELLRALMVNNILRKGGPYILDGNTNIGLGFSKAREHVASNYDSYYERLEEKS